MRIGEMKESKYIKKEDVGQAGKNFVISYVKQENIAGEGHIPEMKYLIFFEGQDKGMVLNWTNIQLIAQITGTEETDDWKGKTVQLYEDPTISFGGKITGGIRIRNPNNAVQMQDTQSENPAPTGNPY